MAHSDERLRAEYGAQVEHYLATLEGILGTRKQATVVLATLVGAVTVARALATPALADEVLADVRASLRHR